MKMLGTTLALLGGLLVTNVSLLLSSAWNTQDAKSKLEDDWAVINEDADSRKLQYYKGGAGRKVEEQCKW